MNPHRIYKLLRKHSSVLIEGLRPSAIHGRFIGPKVLVNSIPKSGTNLLLQLILSLPLMRGKISRALNLDSGSEYLINKLSGISKGVCVGGHIIYDEVVGQAIHSNEIRHVLIIRDFRDAIFSNIQYLATNHTSHPHNKLFSSLTTLDEKIEACLIGNEEMGIRAWPTLIRDYRGWLSHPNTFIVRFENLISQDSRIAYEEINQIVNFLGIELDADASSYRNGMFNPQGLTYNSPGINKWKKNFNQHQIDILNQALCEELTFFGYEI